MHRFRVKTTIWQIAPVPCMVSAVHMCSVRTAPDLLVCRICTSCSSMSCTLAPNPDPLGQTLVFDTPQEDETVVDWCNGPLTVLGSIISWRVLRIRMLQLATELLQCIPATPANDDVQRLVIEKQQWIQKSGNNCCAKDIHESMCAMQMMVCIVNRLFASNIYEQHRSNKWLSTMTCAYCPLRSLASAHHSRSDVVTWKISSITNTCSLGFTQCEIIPSNSSPGQLE